MKNDYFRLFASCVPVRGAKRSILCDLQRGSFKFIPNSLTDLLQELRIKPFAEVRDSLDNSEDQATFDEYIHFMIENEYGFLCSKEDLFLFPEIDFSPPDPTEDTVISNAIIDVSNSSEHNFGKILPELESLGCKHLQIRSYSFLDFIALAEDILAKTKTSRFLSVDFIARYNKSTEESALINLLIKFSRLNEIVIHSSPAQKIINDPFKMGRIIYTTEVISSSHHCGIISPHYFSKNKEAFIASQRSNSCLDGKISLDEGGEIKNCPSLVESYGNIKTTTFKEALLSKDYKKLWSVTKDQIDVCRDCEFRYICTDCRAFVNSITSKPEKCNYNPYTATWNS